MHSLLRRFDLIDNANETKLQEQIFLLREIQRKRINGFFTQETKITMKDVHNNKLVVRSATNLTWIECWLQLLMSFDFIMFQIYFFLQEIRWLSTTVVNFMQKIEISMSAPLSIKEVGGINTVMMPTSMDSTWKVTIRHTLMGWTGLIGMDIITHSKQQKWRSEDSRPMMLIYCVWSSVILDLFLDYLNKQYSNFCLFVIIKYKKISLTIFILS